MKKKMFCTFILALVLPSINPAFAKNYLDTTMDREEFHAHITPLVDEVTAAIYKAEGGKSAKKPFGILSVPCDDYADCEKIAKRTVRNNYVRWMKAGRPGEFIDFLGGRYAPVNVHPLNRHWVKNVNAIAYGGTEK